MCKRLLSDRDGLVKNATLSILLELTKNLTLYYMDASNASIRAMRKQWPPLLDLMHPAYSWVVQALQY